MIHVVMTATTNRCRRYPGVVEAITARRRREQLQIVSCAVRCPQQQVTRYLFGFQVRESRCIEDTGREQDDQHSDACTARTNIATSVEWMTNSDVSTERHVHCQ